MALGVSKFLVLRFLIGGLLFWAVQLRAESFDILLFGDFGTGGLEQYQVGEAMAKTCAEKSCDLAVSLGDNFYPEGVSSIEDPKFITHFREPYKKLLEIEQLSFYLLLGNHDYKGNVQAQIDYGQKFPQWKIPARHYALSDLPEGVSVYALDTEPLTETSAFKRKFSKSFKRNLKRQNRALAAKLCSETGWRIVFGHHPLFSSGKEKNKNEEKALRDSVLDTIQKCQVDFYFSGHEHFQEHIRYKNVDAIVQGAASQIRLDSSPIDEPGAASVFQARELGYSLLRLEKSRALVEFYDVEGREIYSFVREKEIAR